MMWDELFQPPFDSKIQKNLPVLLNMVELENKRGNKLGMEVGSARERVIIALFMYIYGNRSVALPPTTDFEHDAIVNGCPVSIKTKSSKSLGGVKLSWTVDWDKVDKFVSTYSPGSDLLYVNILWGSKGGFFLIPKDVQTETLEALGREEFFKLAKRGTNPRGIELSSKAMKFYQAHKDTRVLVVDWKRDPSLLVERALYGRWVDLWDCLP